MRLYQFMFMLNEEEKAMTKNDVMKACGSIERMMESRSGNLEKPLTSHSELNEVFTNFSKCCYGKTITTICQNVAEFYRKYKFDVQPEGIGWKITCPLKFEE